MEIINGKLEEILPKVEKAFSSLVHAAYDKRGRVVIGLVGGRSMNALFERIPGLKLPLPAMHFFWGDERCVSIKSDESNYSIAKNMLEKLVENGLPNENIHPFIAKMDQPDWGIFQYQKIFDSLGGKFDLLVLGAGEDGHVLSLFPNHPSIQNNSFDYIMVKNSPKLPPNRISISRRLAESANSSILFFLGEGKHEAYKRFNNPNFSVIECPAKIVQSHRLSYVFTDYPQ